MSTPVLLFNSCQLPVCCCRYTDRQLDREFIEVLRETCFKLVERSEVRSTVSSITIAGGC